MKVRFTGDKTYSVQWTELLTPAELPFSSVEELTPGTAVLAPYTDDAPGNIEHSPAVIEVCLVHVILSPLPRKWAIVLHGLM